MARFGQEGICEDERIWLRPLDVTDAEQRQAVVNEIEREFGAVYALINNAGVTFRAVVEHVSEAERLAQMDINFRSPMELARTVLPAMRARREGRILNISSVGGMMAMPTMAVYSASKFALEGASEALYYELRPFGVHVSLVEPGFIASDAFQKVRYTTLSQGSSDLATDPYHAHYTHMSSFIARVMGLSFATPERVAKRVVHTLLRRHPPLRVAGTPDAMLFDLMRRWLPRRVYHELLYRSLPQISQWGQPQLPSETK